MAATKKAKELGRPADTDSEQTRLSILRAAEYCFATRGFKNTSNRDVADRAGVTAATIYYYFKNKSDLFVSVNREVQEKVIAGVREVVDEAETLVDGLVAIANVFLDVHKDDPNIAKFNAVVRQEAMRNPELSDVLEDQHWRDIFHELAELGKRTGELDPKKDRELRAVLSLVNFGISHHASESSMAAHEECIRGVIDLFRGNLLKPPRKK